MKTFYTGDFTGAAMAIIDANRYADTQLILRDLGVQRLRDISPERKTDFETIIKRLGFEVFEGENNG